MSRLMQARSKKAIKRQLILDAAAFLWLLAFVVIALPLLAAQ